MSNSFQQLKISNRFAGRLKQMGIHEPTAIQEQTIPVILNNTDVIAKAQTGTGKTLAFLLPILEKINPDKPNVQALIVSPTRELALQITEEIRKLTRDEDRLNHLAVYGGQDIEGQLKKLKRGVQIVVATPGRLLDHLRRGTVNLTEVAMFVMDEADQMLHMGFANEMEDIISQLPAKRQTMLFSATMPKEVRKLAYRYMDRPADVRAEGSAVTLDEVKQMVIETSDREKQEKLRKVLDQFRPFLAIIFCRTKRRAITLNEALQRHGYLSDELHGDLSQAKREKVMKQFRNMKLQYLVATDVAARGLDVEGVTHVINYDIPQDAESYIHRIGRTARAGGEGIAITFVAPKDKKYLDLIEKGIKTPIKKKSIQ